MKWRFSVEDTFLVCTERYRAFIHHSSLSFLNLKRFQKINHREEFHQCNYIKIPHWRKLCDEICSEKECFSCFFTKILLGESTDTSVASRPLSLPRTPCPAQEESWKPSRSSLFQVSGYAYTTQAQACPNSDRSQNRSVSQQDWVILIHNQTALDII